jgi:hypothetical protein
MGFFRKKEKNKAQDPKANNASDSPQTSERAVNSHPTNLKRSTVIHEHSSSLPLHDDQKIQSNSHINPAPPYSESATRITSTAIEHSPFPILEQLVALVQDLKEFVELHQNGIKTLEDRIVTYESEKPTLDIDIVISFIQNTVVPFYEKFRIIFNDPSYGFNPTSTELKNINSCFKPLLGKVSELREEIVWHIDPEKKSTLKELMSSKTRHVFMKYQQFASQSSTHIRKHLKELSLWLEAEDFKELVDII